ncbi:MAG TPA: hypothetical protein VGK50_05035 [Coriobacteriia bacterium]
MQSAEGRDVPVKAKAVLIDPASMTVSWINESAAQDFSDRGGDGVCGLPAEEALPMTGAVGVPEAVRYVAETGVARHLRTGLVSTAKGSVAIVTSVYRLPDGRVLVLTENAWQAERGTTERDPLPRSGRRGR